MKIDSTNPIVQQLANKIKRSTRDLDVSVDKYYNPPRIYISINESLDVNFSLFKAIFDVLQTENISVTQNHKTYMLSEVTADSWENVTFEVSDVPEHILEQIF